MLELFKGYTRKEVHDIFEPTTAFTPSSGTWGMWGIIQIKGTKDYVFYVNKNTDPYGDELYYDGIVKWSSQNRMDLMNKMVIDFINHDHEIHNIYLFWQPKGEKLNYYMGLLEYVDHDYTSSNPVKFHWHIIDFREREALKAVPNLELLDIDNKSRIRSNNIDLDAPLNGCLTMTEAPTDVKIPPKTRTGVDASDFEGRNTDFAEEGRKNSALGKAGEDMVVKYEKERLIAAGRPDLAKKVIATRETIGKTAKFDIHSYEVNGAERLIEVKTTTGRIKTPYRISEREVAFSERHSDNYHLYRVYDFNKRTGDGKFYIRDGAVNRATLMPTEYLAY